jgi:hypothetical protein
MLLVPGIEQPLSDAGVRHIARPGAPAGALAS